MKAVRAIHLIGLFPIASGNWNNAADAGLFYRNWNNNRSNDNNNYGFRASDYASAPDNLHGYTGNIGMACPAILRTMLAPVFQ